MFQPFYKAREDPTVGRLEKGTLSKGHCVIIGIMYGHSPKNKQQKKPMSIIGLVNLTLYLLLEIGFIET